MAESPRYTGVVLGENGEPDFRHAAIEGPEKGQEWIDQSRETAYEKLGEFLSALSEHDCAELKKTLVATAKAMAPSGATIELQPDDLEGIKLINYTLDNADEVAGAAISRPVVLFPDYATFTKFASSIGQSSHGMNILLEEGAYAGSSLILSTPDRFFLGHEIMHSIDPNMRNREGTSKILDEALTFYYQCIVEGFNGFSIVENQEDRWKNFSVELSSYFEYAGADLSKDEYKELVVRVKDKLQTLQKEVGDIEVQRLIAKAITLEDLFSA